MSIPGTHRFKGPFDEIAAFTQCPCALGPLQTCPDAVILIFSRHGHHVRIPKNVVAADARQVMDKTYQGIVYERAQRPAACHARNN